MKKRETENLQTQLRQYLKSFRNSHNKTAYEMTKLLDVEIATYRALEGTAGSNRVISSMKYLKKFADLNEMSVTQFVGFLERNSRLKDGSNYLKRPLHNWEKSLLFLFDRVGISLRGKFIDLLERSKEEEFGLNENIELLIQLCTLNTSIKKTMQTLIQQLLSEIKTCENK